MKKYGRIYGVNNIEGKLPKVPTVPGGFNRKLRNIRNKMISLGLNETLSYILINDKEVKDFTTDEFEEVKLLDPMSEDRNTLRYSLITSLLKIYEYNVSHGNKDISIFELGKGFFKKENKYGEDLKLCILMAGEFYTGINEKKAVDFFIVKGVIEEVLNSEGYENRYSFVVPKNMPKEFHPGQTADIIVNGKNVGLVGKLHPVVASDVFVAEINLDRLLEIKTGKPKYKEISKFPSVLKDIALVVDRKIEAGEIAKVIKKACGSNLSEISVFDVYEGAGVGEGKKSIAFSLTFSTQDRTLTDDEINPLLQKIVDETGKAFGAILRA